ncbi:hypothetical protein [Holdemanella biformis]|uniref:hypothetical protein n=1 Tax=Holdemanella biformis TaxID=1735 RepID=UPI0035665476
MHNIYFRTGFSSLSQTPIPVIAQIIEKTGTIKVVVEKLKAEADDSDTEAIITAILDNVKVEKKKCE